MRLSDIIKKANGNLLRNKARTFLTILALFIGSFVIALTTAVNNGFSSYLDSQLASAGGKGIMTVYRAQLASLSSGSALGDSDPQEYKPASSATGADGIPTITNNDIQSMSKIAGVKSAEGYLTPSIEYIYGKNGKKYNIDATMSINNVDYAMTAGTIPSAKSNNSDNTIALTDKFVKALGYSSDKAAIGQTITLVVRNTVTSELSNVTATISGVREPSVVAAGRPLLSVSLSKTLEDRIEEGLPDSMKNQYQVALLEFDANATDSQISALKNRLSSKGFAGTTVDDNVGIIRSLFNSITTVLTIFGAIALLAASIGIINTLFMSVQERTREIGLMKAMGMSGRKIFTMFSAEAIALGFWGAFSGVAIAFGVSFPLNQLANSTFLSALPGFTLLQFTVPQVASIILTVMVIAFSAGTIPSIKASHKDPIEALRYE